MDDCIWPSIYSKSLDLECTSSFSWHSLLFWVRATQLDITHWWYSAWNSWSFVFLVWHWVRRGSSGLQLNSFWQSTASANALYAVTEREIFCSGDAFISVCTTFRTDNSLLLKTMCATTSQSDQKRTKKRAQWWSQALGIHHKPWQHHFYVSSDGLIVSSIASSLLLSIGQNDWKNGKTFAAKLRYRHGMAHSTSTLVRALQGLLGYSSRTEKWTCNPLSWLLPHVLLLADSSLCLLGLPSQCRQSSCLSRCRNFFLPCSDPTWGCRPSERATISFRLWAKV